MTILYDEGSMTPLQFNKLRFAVHRVFLADDEVCNGMDGTTMAELIVRCVHAGSADRIAEVLRGEGDWFTDTAGEYAKEIARRLAETADKYGVTVR